MSNLHCNVVVIGGGHAGIEAAAAAARMGSSVILVTMDASKIGAMHCNPSVGGLGKGHLTYEVSALGGVMPKLCSSTYLQAKMLNTSKGPAVQGLRLQIDKIAYQRLASETMKNYPNVTVLEDEVVEIEAEINGSSKKISYIVTKDGKKIATESVIITTGTFLNSAIYVGKERCNPVKTLNPSSEHLSKSIEKLIEMKLGRLKTGTPPRIAKDSIDYSKLDYQPAHKLDYLFEFDPIDVQEKAACYVTHTTAETQKIIAENLALAGYNPAAKKGMEPRYCPSIETKVSRFPDKESHHVFIEPESLELDEIYPAGLSNSLPREVQERFVRTVTGLENAVLTKPGFMIEYDFLQPINLKYSLEHKQVSGLFFAGQVNGTTGYEEAAAQGIMAGINAHLYSAGQEPFILSRYESYIGVMIDDLVTLGVDEPYRMFTSRAERRLILRQDNVFERLYPHALRLGLITQADFDKFEKEKEVIDKCFAMVKQFWARSEIFNILHSVELSVEQKARAKEILTDFCLQNGLDARQISPRTITSLHALVRYDGYLAREQQEIEKFKKYAELTIPADFVFDCIAGLSTEIIEKLNRHRPKTIAQAQLISGITPAAISLLIFRVREFLESKNQKQS